MGQWNYGYDNLNRLVNATTTSGPFVDQSSSWTYDAFGNRLSEINPVANTSATFTPASNQVTATSGTAVFVYDAAGNVTYDGLNHYLYDAEGRVCAVSNFVGTITGYIYDAAGIRVAKVNLNQFSCNLGYGYATTNSYVLGLGGEQITEFNINGGASIWAHTNVFSGGALLATYSPTSNSTGSTLSGSSVRTSTYFALNDWLGTKRAEVGANGCVSTYTGMPFGGGLTSNGNCTDPTEHHFTGKEHDAETGNDYFAARYYNSAMGRWMSPDWSAKEEPVPYAKLDNPQTLNLYQYVGNNPLSKADADGHCWPLCTILAGAAVGAATSGGIEFGVQLIQHHGHISETNWNKVGNAALGGLVTGAITGALGPAAGVALKVGVSTVAAVSGGVVEKAVNGEKIIATGILIDAAAGAAGHKVEKIAEKTFAIEALQKLVPKAIDATKDTVQRVNDKANEKPEHKEQERKLGER